MTIMNRASGSVGEKKIKGTIIFYREGGRPFTGMG